MFDIGWSEMAIIALVALLVFGPKELPNALRTGAKWMKTARKLAREFQSGVDQLVREAELEEAKKLVTDVKTSGIGKAIEKTIDPEGEVKSAFDPKTLQPDRDTPVMVKPAPTSGTTASIPVPEPTKTEPQALSAPDGDTVPMPAETKPETQPLVPPDAATVPMPQSQPADQAEALASQSDSLKKTA
jgi:sec-independent protein translocase protein TatB